MQSQLREKLSGFCRHWSEAVSRKNDSEDRLAFFRTELPGLLAQRELFYGILEGIIRGGSYPDTRQATLFDNEFIVPIGDWEKNPRLQAKTSVSLRYGTLPSIEPHRL